jgi:cysteine-rich repeat protein
MASTSRLSNILCVLVVGTIAIAIAACASPAVQECGATGVLCPAGTHCAAAEGVCLPDTNTCGNAHLDPGEVCDDGNTKDGDGCSHDCLSDETCGNGIPDHNARVPELCDDGNTRDGDGCSHDCLSLEKCGDGHLNINEECDDGNTDPGDGCSPKCLLEKCGNGILDPGEACDLLPVDTARCSADCKSTRMCGNGIVDPGEECDLGGLNSNNGDCRADCVFNRCGDGFKNTLGSAGHPEHIEQCDDAAPAAAFSRTVKSPESAACNNDCTAPSCGDGKVNHSFTPPGATGPEQCDNVNSSGVSLDADNADCSATCQVSVCGDNHRNTVGPDLKEGCDDGNRVDTDACTNGCVAKACGDGIVGPGEECDLGAANSDTGACLPNCVLATCGDGKVHTGFEECDGAAGLQPCAANCRQQKCGNGIIDPNEECDNGAANNDAGDCRSDCVLNRCGDGHVNTLGLHKEACDGGPVAAAGSHTVTPTNTAGCNLDCTAPSCGDNIVNPLYKPDGTHGEQCGPPSVTNGCSATCQFEHCGNGMLDPGEQCDGTTGLQPCSSTCFQQICGNGIIDPGELCDLGAGANGPNSACPSCQLARCGDGKLETGVEECDLTTGLQPCSTTCRQQKCGNGIIDPTEECDNGAANSDSGDCRTDCILNRCGDGHINTLGLHPEACDGGPVAAAGSHTVTPTDTPTCDRDCTAPSCADSLVNPTFKPDGTHGEQCGPPSATNGCSATCLFENCGNGIKDPGEACDDGNAIESDGCDTNCTLPACGNGIVDTGEACDDGNTIDGDGCDHNCTNSTTCGNGVLDAGELCDDGNTTCGACGSTCAAITSQPATGLIFAAAGAAYSGTPTFILNDGILPAVTFELTKTVASGTNFAIVYAMGDNNVTVANAIAIAIGTASPLITATAVNGVVVLQHKRPTSFGNQPIVNNVTAAGWLVSGMSGGAGGNCVTGKTCTQAIDCKSNSCIAGVCI